MRCIVLAGIRKSRAWLARAGANTSATASIEFAMITPAMLMLMAIVTFAAQGFELQRKVTLTMRTLTDLVTQQTEVGSTSTTYTYSQILAAASLVMAPYDASLMQMTISEIQTNGTTSGTVIWSKATGTGAVALTKNATVTVPSNLASPGYLIYGVVTYKYNPLQIFMASNSITLADSIYMSPRISGSVACTGC